MNEQQVREYVHKLRRFYTDVFIYGVVNLGLILIWAISGGGYFWPIWVIIGWGIGLGIHAFSLGLIPQMNAVIPFMTAEWEDKEVRRITAAGYKDKEKEEKKAVKKVEAVAEKKLEETNKIIKKITPISQKKRRTKITKKPKI